MRSLGCQPNAFGYFIMSCNVSALHKGIRFNVSLYMQILVIDVVVLLPVTLGLAIAEQKFLEIKFPLCNVMGDIMKTLSI